MSAAAKGRATEWQVRDALLAAGYDVTRAAASLGDWDLLAISIPLRQILFIEVKLGYWPSGQEKRELDAFAERKRQQVLASEHPYTVACMIIRKDKRRGWRQRRLYGNGIETVTPHEPISQAIKIQNNNFHPYPEARDGDAGDVA